MSPAATGDFAGVIDEELRYGAERSVLHSEHSDPQVRPRELDRQYFQGLVPGRERQYRGRYHGEKTSSRRESRAHIDSVRIDGRAWSFEPARPKGFNNERIERSRPSPGLVQQIGKLDFASTEPWTIQACHHRQGFFQQELLLQVLFGKSAAHTYEAKLDATLAQFFVNRWRGNREDMKDHLRIAPRELIDNGENDSLRLGRRRPDAHFAHLGL